MITNEHIGRKVVMFREPTTAEWEGIGRINIDRVLGVETILQEIYSTHKNSVTTSGGGWYPICCFKLAEDEYTIY